MKKIKGFTILACLALTTAAHAVPSEEYDPIYAGTQLAFYPTNASPGHIAVQPYFSYVRQYGLYNSEWNEKSSQNINGVGNLLSLETGITDWLDITLILNQAYRQFKNMHCWVFGDTSVYLGFQLLHDKKHEWVPDLRLLLGETFPTGKYDRLNPHRGGSDIFGTGSYTTTLILVLAKTFYTYPRHPYNLNLNVYYINPSNVPVHGMSLYGGTPATHGKAFPHSGFITNLAVEYSLNQFWALGMDIRYVHQNKTIFKNRDNLPHKTSISSSDQFSLAPCLEYSWSLNFSTAIGPWFTVAGRNSTAFFGIIGNIYCYF